MDSFNREALKIIDDVMQHLDVLQGTEYANCADDVRIELTNRLEDLAAMVQSKADLEVNPKATIQTIWLDNRKYRICHINTQIAGEGIKAFGGVGVAWAEDISYNIGLQVTTNIQRPPLSQRRSDDFLMNGI